MFEKNNCKNTLTGLVNQDVCEPMLIDNRETGGQQTTLLTRVSLNIFLDFLYEHSFYPLLWPKHTT
jgi:hypothetical protein